MGQKVNPIGFRVGVSRSWGSSWYAKKNYKDFLHGDIVLRRFLEQRLEAAGLSQVKIERSAKRIIVTVHASRPGVVIGKKGSDIEKLRKDLSQKVGADISLNIVDVRKPEVDARLVADGIARQLERRASFRRAMKRAVQAAMRLGAEGIRVNVRGRLGGAEIARMEWYREGRVPLHTLRADVDFAIAVARTSYGTCGVKVWVYKGEVYDGIPKEEHPDGKADGKADGNADGKTDGKADGKTDGSADGKADGNEATPEASATKEPAGEPAGEPTAETASATPEASSATKEPAGEPVGEPTPETLKKGEEKKDVIAKKD